MTTELSISDPRFNLREIAKQLILLEEHLLEKGKYCPDCISKHMLNIEALADEGQSLDDRQVWQAMFQNYRWAARRWAEMFTSGTDPKAIGQEVRQMRKKVAPLVISPIEPDHPIAPIGYAGLSPGSFGVSNWGAWLAIGIGIAGLIWWSEKRR